MTLRRPHQLRPHRLLWVKHHYEPGDGPREPVWYAPAVDIKRSVTVEQRADGWYAARDEGLIIDHGPYGRLVDAIASAERLIFTDIRTTVDAVGGWAAVCAAAQEAGAT